MGGAASVEVTAKGGGPKLKLDVRVLQKQEFKLDIRFVGCRSR